ncbi:MAG: tRNA (adenosine(37)-N6)-threonylcarbamoyltransferase complex transferase subunit TsaD [Hyphomicrobiales bacterium]
MPVQTSRALTVLGIESSCDETAAAIVRRGADGHGTILSNWVRSQDAAHAPFGGVVPEIAARAHVSHIDRVVKNAFDEADCGFDDIDAVAATAGPGLIGGVIVGLMTAKAIALVHDLPLIAVNHLEGHALTPRLTDGIAFPYLLLLVSGGHTQLQSVEGVDTYRRLGTTIDDALGEAFDKTAKLLGLGFPGGPAVERTARSGDPERFSLPRPLAGQAGCNFSFSGLKTAVLKTAQANEPLSDGDKADLCAGFQAATADCVRDRTRHAMAAFRAAHPNLDEPVLVVAGGVAANSALRAALDALCRDEGFTLNCPPPALCTDNAAMIAWAGAERLALGLTDGLDAVPRARWPLDPDAEPAPGAGVKA